MTKSSMKRRTKWTRLIYTAMSGARQILSNRPTPLTQIYQCNFNWPFRDTKWNCFSCGACGWVEGFSNARLCELMQTVGADFNSGAIQSNWSWFRCGRARRRLVNGNSVQMALRDLPSMAHSPKLSENGILSNRFRRKPLWWWRPPLVSPARCCH